MTVTIPLQTDLLSLPLSPEQLDTINEQLRNESPQGILTWAVTHLPNLYQTTAFGLTGLAATDMLAKITTSPPPLIFIDTLYHFKETLDLANEVQRRYQSTMHVYRPEGTDTVEDFERIHGQKLWETDEPRYDYLVKVEPARRAYRELNVQAVITGRRATQGADRANLQPIEVDATGCVGDWHSTIKSGSGDAGERAGRWAGKEKTECGLHQDYFKLKLLAMKKQREEELRLKDESRPDTEALPSSTIVSTN
ncbi:phosphoadenylyl-sulfate reductase (thioredoxin) [Rhizoctonia solani]|uniref:Phosphoadenylyl-sulfate reductase (Thioredoxin) n=1 Tax=Rhizoctonia solani TaxID=456999 RepID=A0A8H8NNP0_9AGAM|nr:phosphoadenylyl-sulfate reductase (thioredoxin) [Rhizoctonia solani]QRW15795.1 phosphoadenylyl-sulfate reductase (thioredoxin) [Rhizoctonia solani]